MILAIDTSASRATIGLKHNKTVYQTTIDEPKEQSEKLLMKLDELLTFSETDLKSINYIAVAKGPGSFTGLRVGISFVQAMAYALNIPVVAINSLQILAQHAHRKHELNELIVAVDARMQEVYWAKFKLFDGIMQQDGGIFVSQPSDLILQVPKTLAIVGNAKEAFPELNAHFINYFNTQSQAEDIIDLAIYYFEQGQVMSASELVPEYVRDNVAKKTSER